jgi:hypothetical protein
MAYGEPAGTGADLTRNVPWVLRNAAGEWQANQGAERKRALERPDLRGDSDGWRRYGRCGSPEGRRTPGAIDIASERSNACRRGGNLATFRYADESSFQTWKWLVNRSALTKNSHPSPARVRAPQADSIEKQPLLVAFPDARPVGFRGECQQFLETRRLCRASPATPDGCSVG